MCVFCKMVRGEIAPQVVLEDDEILAFHDISPQAPIHVLIVPKRHIESLAQAEESDGALLGKLLLAAKRVAQTLGLGGFRTVLNSGAQAGQSVFHLHLHVLGGRPLGWPPG